MGQVKDASLPPSLWTEAGCYSQVPQGSPLLTPKLLSASKSPLRPCWPLELPVCPFTLTHPFSKPAFPSSPRHFPTHGSAPCFCLFHSCQGLCDLVIVQLPLGVSGLMTNPLFWALSGLGPLCSILAQVSSFSQFLWLFPRLLCWVLLLSCSVIAP